MRTYKLYQIGIVDNLPYLTYVAETEAADESTAEETLLQNLPDDKIVYLITVVK